MRAMAAVSIVMLLMAGCAGKTVNVRAQPPAEAASLCSQLPEPADESLDAVVVAYADVLDEYTRCAARHKALAEWARGK